MNESSVVIGIGFVLVILVLFVLMFFGWLYIRCGYNKLTNALNNHLSETLGRHEILISQQHTTERQQELLTRLLDTNKQLADVLSQQSEQLKSIRGFLVDQQLTLTDIMQKLKTLGKECHEKDQTDPTNNTAERALAEQSSSDKEC